MTDPTELVAEFCSLMSKRNPAQLSPFLADDATYQNVGMPAVLGREAILRNLESQFAMYPDSYAYEMVNIAASGALVLTERLDFINRVDGELVAVPVMGTFVLAEDKILRWSDYWDLSLPKKLLAGEDCSALLPQR
ncbi:limonene-1,2-epoxide hydrolase family protein [Rhodococcus koreensis]